MSEFGFLIMFIVSIIAMIITWKVSNNFISIKERIFKNRFQIFLTKLGMCASVGIITFILTFKLIDSMTLNKPKAVISTHISTNKNDLDKNSKQLNSTKTEINKSTPSDNKNEVSLQNTLKKNKVIKDSVSANFKKHQEELDKAIEMLKRDKSVKEISDSTSITKKEIRQLKRKLRKEE